MQIFNQLRWMTDNRAPVTVPEEEGSYRPGVAIGRRRPGASACLCAAALRRHAAHAGARAARSAARGVLDGPPDALRERLLAQFAESGQPGIAGWPPPAISGSSGATTPGCARHPAERAQFGWWNPAYIYGIGLHGAGFDVVGNTPFAIRACCSATTRTWPGGRRRVSATTSTSTPKLDPADRTRYFHDGQWKRMEKRSELILVRAASRC